MDINVFTNEIMCTFIFISVILMVKGKYTADARVGIGAAMCVVLTLLCCISASNKLGACFNPAVGSTLTINSILYLGKQHRLYRYAYAYIAGPFIGALCAGVFHNLHAPSHEPEEEHREFDASQKEKMLS